MAKLYSGKDLDSLLQLLNQKNAWNFRFTAPTLESKYALHYRMCGDLWKSEERSEIFGFFYFYFLRNGWFLCPFHALNLDFPFANSPFHYRNATFVKQSLLNHMTKSIFLLYNTFKGHALKYLARHYFWTQPCLPSTYYSSNLIPKFPSTLI